MFSGSFIGRNEELERFEATLEKYSAAKPAIVFIYDAAENDADKGGIGKTWLLQQFLQIAQSPKYQDRFLVNAEMFDFHNPVFRDRLSRIVRFVRFLENEMRTENFSSFWKILGEYHARGVEMERVLQEYYECFLAAARQMRKKVVLFFDTFEAAEKTLNHTRRPFRFIEDDYEGSLLFVISGRNAPDLKTPLWEGRDDRIVRFALRGFSNDEATTFFRNAGHDKLDSRLIAKLNRKAGGRPILLGLMSDYLKRIIRVEDILRLDDRTFQQQLVAFLKQFKAPPLDLAIIAMAHLKHGCDRRLLQQLVKVEEGFDSYYQQLRDFSFVRRLGGREEYLALHDEMQRMVSQYILKNRQDEKFLRQAISRDTLPFYEQKIQELEARTKEHEKTGEFSRQQAVRNEMLIWQAQHWYHRLYLSDGTNLSDYLDNFYDPIFENSLLDFCFVFLEHLYELETLLTFRDHDRNRLQMRWMRLNMKMFESTGNDYYRGEAEKTADALLKKARRSGEAPFLGTVLSDCGQLQICLGHPKEAEIKMRASIAALKVKPETTDHNLLYYQGKLQNWFGYSAFLQGKFRDAITALVETEKCLLKAETHLEADQSMEPARKELRHKQIDEWFAQVRGNLCRIYRELGDFPEALFYGESSLMKRLQLGNKKEILKGYNSLGLVYERQGDLKKAFDFYKKAEELLWMAPDPILKGRILTNKATVLFKREGFSRLLTIHRRETLAEAKREIGVDEEGRTNARILLTEAISLLPTNSRELAIACINLGELDLMEDQHDNALANFKKAVEVSQLRHDAYFLLNALQRLTLAAYLKNDAKQLNGVAQNFIAAQTRLKNPEVTARYVVRFHLTLGNFHYDKLREENYARFHEPFKAAFNAYTEALAHAHEFVPAYKILAQEVFAERMLALLKIGKKIPPTLQNELTRAWKQKGLDATEVEKYFNF